MSINLIDLRSKPSIEDYQIEKAKHCPFPIVKMKTTSGWRIMDSPYDPIGEAQAAFGDEIDPESEVFVLGIGSGFIASELLNREVSTITLITASHVLAERSNRILSEYSDNKKKITIIVITALKDSLLSLLNALIEDKSKLKIITHPRETKAYPSLFNPLTVYLSSWTTPVNRRPHKHPKRVLFPCAGELCEPEIQKDLLRKGIKVITIESFSNRNIQPRQAWDLICQHEPDLILSTNNKGSDREGLVPEACECAAVPWVTWFLDEPRFIVTHGEISDRQKRFGFCWDIAGIEACQKLGFKKAALLPLATDPDHFSPGQGDESLNHRIVYVGSPSFGNEERYFSGIRDDPKAHRVAKIFEKKLWKQRRLPSHEDIENALHACDITNHFSRAALKRLPAFVLYKANLSYRIAALTALADLNPVVYGEGWLGLLPDTIELRGYADYYQDIVNIYRSDAVHLSLTHLQMRLYPNQRIFDVGACGRIVIGDRIEGWKDLFGSDFDDLIFNDFKDLRAKAIFFTNNQRAREYLGESLRHMILKRHTFSHRIDRIFEVVYPI